HGYRDQPVIVFFFQAEDGIRDFHVTGVQTCALPIYLWHRARPAFRSTSWSRPVPQIHANACSTAPKSLSPRDRTYGVSPRITWEIGRASCREGDVITEEASG